jgi:uncharacterized protein YyaL (SSP411 family)
MANRLADQNSPYLLQHKDNPVDWYPWGEVALEKARSEDKPIFLSIGYAACHWCHVMAHESFEDPSLAAYMNENFVNVKVDREERPDLDSIYMSAVVAMTGQGGWPMSVFLTPDGKPFYGGTYFPPVRRYNMPSFREVLESIQRIWREDRQQALQHGEELTGYIRKNSQAELPGSGSLSQAYLDQAALQMAQSYDWQAGGWGKAPKFPQPMAIEFLLMRATLGDRMARDISMHALDAMSRGGMYDVVGGGFARYSTDDRWLVPHFEKMLYDNAQLARVYLQAYTLGGNPVHRQTCEATLDFIVRELIEKKQDGSPLGGIFSSLDADSEGEEGRYYVWSPEEIQAALPEQADQQLYLAAYGVTAGGNFEGKTVLQRQLEDSDLAERFGLPQEAIPSRLQQLNDRLLAARQDRIRPGTDDKVLVSWNGLALIAFAEAARYLQRTDYLQIARFNADFLLGELALEDRLLRSWRNGEALHNAYLEDYAALILGLLALYQSDPDPYWFNSAVDLTQDMIKQFSDPDWGFFDTRSDHEVLVTRPKDLQDNATPSGNALAAHALLQMAAYTANGEWRDMAERMLAMVQGIAVRYPTSFSKWLSAMLYAQVPIQEVAILGNPNAPRTAELVQALWAEFRPFALLAQDDYPPAQNAPPLLSNRQLLAGETTAYVCRNFVCKLPVQTPQALLAQLDPQA